MENREYLIEINYDTNFLNNEVVNNEASLTNEQKHVYDNVVKANPVLH